MKKLTVILFASVVLNGALAGYIALRLPATPTPPAKTPPVITSKPARTGISDETKRLLAEESAERLDELRDRLRAEGLPESVVRSVVEQRLWQARQLRLDAADPNKKRPWWQRMSGHLPGDDVRMARLEEKLMDELQSKRAELFPETEKSTPDDSIAFLPAAKREAVQRLRDDYRELHRKLLIQSGGAYSQGSYVTAADRQKLTFLGEEEEKDLRALLTSEEYGEMQLRTPGAESVPKKASALLDLSEHQFRGLMAIREWRNNAEPIDLSVDPFAAMSPEMELKRQQLADEEKRKLDELLGTEKRQLLDQTKNFKYEDVARYIARFDLPQSHIPAYLALFQKATDDAAAINSNATLSPEQRTQSLKSIAQTYDTSIAKLLGPAALEENLGMNDLLFPARTSCFVVDEK